jgi:hypothetical protein
MGIILNGYKELLVDSFINGVSANTTRLYAFASNPVSNEEVISTDTIDDKSSVSDSNWNLLFGKKLSNNDIKLMTRKIEWTSNTVYSRYDDRDANLANSNFFVMKPTLPGQVGHIYKCLDNANGTPSTSMPNLIQATSFTTADGYMWKYMYSIHALTLINFSTSDYIPIVSNSSMEALASTYNGIEVIDIVESGNGYSSYHDGIVRGVVNSSLIQIENAASSDNSFYTNNGIYIYNSSSDTSQLNIVSNYVANLSGKWVYLQNAANTTNILSGITNYKISPRVVFDVNSDDIPSAYTVINPIANSVSDVIIINPGSGISRADARLVSNTIYGSGANLHCIVAPVGGHASNPASELGVNGIGIIFNFNNTEDGSIPSDVLYNKIGIYKDPYTLNPETFERSIQYNDSTFRQILRANVSSSTVFDVGEIVYGQTSGAKGLVAFSNSSTIYLSGDVNFSNNEIIVSANTDTFTTITINNYGDLFTKDLMPIYVQNIDDVIRANNQTESFKILITI